MIDFLVMMSRLKNRGLTSGRVDDNEGEICGKEISWQYSKYDVQNKINNRYWWYNFQNYKIKETIRKRLETFHNHSLPVVEHYGPTKCFKVIWYVV